MQYPIYNEACEGAGWSYGCANSDSMLFFFTALILAGIVILVLVLKMAGVLPILNLRDRISILNNVAERFQKATRLES